MKIVSVDVMLFTPEEVPPSRPVLCRINTDEGIYGLGEAGAILVTGATAVFNMLKEMSRYIIGMDPLKNEVIWDKLMHAGYWTLGNGSVGNSAISAIDIALWDIRGKALGKPVYTLLGGKFRDKLRCYASQLQFGMYDGLVPQYTAEDYRTVAQIAMEKGYDAVKVDVMNFGRDPGHDFWENENYGILSPDALSLIDERLCAIRETIGPKCDLILEQHCGTTFDAAVQIAQIAQPYNIMYMEEPISPLNPQLTHMLAKTVNIRLTAGERIYLREGFLPYLTNRSLAMIQPDLGVSGGISEGKKICDLAHCFEVGVQTHCCGTGIGLAASLHLEAAIPNFTIHEVHVLALTTSFKEFTTLNCEPEDGYFTVPAAPGLGVDLTEAALKRVYMETVQ